MQQGPSGIAPPNLIDIGSLSPQQLLRDHKKIIYITGHCMAEAASQSVASHHRGVCGVMLFAFNWEYGSYWSVFVMC